MKKKVNSGFNLGTVSMLIGLVLCIIKGCGLGLATWSWWAVTAFIWGPFALFFAIMLGFAAIVWVRGGVDKTARSVFDTDSYVQPRCNCGHHRDDGESTL